MSLFTRLASLKRNLFHCKRAESDLDAELRSYADLLADEHSANGVTPDQARRRAQIELGGIEQVKENVREARGPLAEDRGERGVLQHREERAGGEGAETCVAGGLDLEQFGAAIDLADEDTGAPCGSEAIFGEIGGVVLIATRGEDREVFPAAA